MFAKAPNDAKIGNLPSSEFCTDHDAISQKHPGRYILNVFERKNWPILPVSTYPTTNGTDWVHRYTSDAITIDTSLLVPAVVCTRRTNIFIKN